VCYLSIFLHQQIVYGQSQGCEFCIGKIQSNYPIISQSHDLFFANYSEKWYFRYNCPKDFRSKACIDSVKTAYYTTLCTKRYTLAYTETSGTIRLRYLLVQEHKDFWMRVGSTYISHKSTLDDVLEIFHIAFEDENHVCYGIAPLMVGNKVRIQTHYILGLRTGEDDDTVIAFIFDKHKKLIVIEIDYYDKTMVELSN